MRASHNAGTVAPGAPGGSALPRGGLAVLLPGSGSDEVFVRAALAGPLRAIGLTVRAPPVSPGLGLVRGYLRALDNALEQTANQGVRLLVGGVSLGAQVAARWAAARLAFSAGPAGEVLSGLLVALPAWTGQPGPAPAARAALATADAVRRDGLAATIADTRARTPRWLGDELARAWRRHGPALADSLTTAAATPGPTETRLAGLALPTALVGLRDDPVHPLRVAERWHQLLPRSALVVTTLEALGRDPASLGRALALAWLRTGQPPAATPGGGADLGGPQAAGGPG